MARRSAIVFCCLCWFGLPEVLAQSGGSAINTFGYFQVLFQHAENTDDLERNNSFSVQQLNLIFQKDFSRRWLAFINFEVLNNFSSSRRWGSFDLDEAWVRYRANRQLILKVGLHVPVFNHLNEIKNRTPLLPYVIRPLVYEESFAEIIDVEEFIPDRAFVQVKGTLPVGKARLDYAVYLGNSPNINSQFDNQQQGGSQQTGVDTTTTVLVGGRAGLRMGELELGVSATRESVNFLRALVEVPGVGTPLLEGIPADRFNGVPRTRLGVDLSVHPGKFSFEGELIAVRYGVDPPPELRRLPDGREPRIDFDRLFYYGTLGYEVAEHLFVYGSYWYTEQAFLLQTPDRTARDDRDIEVFTVGARYSVLQDEDGFDQITLKAQYLYVPFQSLLELDTVSVEEDQEIHLFGLALSVLF